MHTEWMQDDIHESYRIDDIRTRGRKPGFETIETDAFEAS